MIEKAVRKARGNRKEVVTKLQRFHHWTLGKEGISPASLARETSLQHLHQDAL